jgi:hypothetical protein
LGTLNRVATRLMPGLPGLILNFKENSIVPKI